MSNAYQAIETLLEAAPSFPISPGVYKYVHTSIGKGLSSMPPRITKRPEGVPCSIHQKTRGFQGGMYDSSLWSGTQIRQAKAHCTKITLIFNSFRGTKHRCFRRNVGTCAAGEIKPKKCLDQRRVLRGEKRPTRFSCKPYATPTVSSFASFPHRLQYASA